jgi:hypothetical protein
MSGERLSVGYERPWVYPELHFGFGYSRFEPGDDPTVLVQDVLRDLGQVTRFALPKAAPDGFPEQPHYGYSLNRAKRIDKYLKETVKAPYTKGIVRKEDIVDIYKAADTVMDALAETNHPVVQAIAAVDQDFTDLLPRQEIDFVAMDVIRQTNWTGLRPLLNLQVVDWRIEQSLDSGTYGRLS